MFTESKIEIFYDTGKVELTVNRNSTGPEGAGGLVDISLLSISNAGSAGPDYQQRHSSLNR